LRETAETPNALWPSLGLSQRPLAGALEINSEIPTAATRIKAGTPIQPVLDALRGMGRTVFLEAGLHTLDFIAGE
jgi:hypothetical protein